MCVAFGNDRFAEIFSRGFERETVRNLERRWQKSFRENFLNGRGSFRHFCECGRNRRARRREREQAQNYFRDDTEHSFGADEQSDQIKAGLVFVHAPTGAQNLAICEDDFETGDVIARHAVLQTARPAGVGGDISANAAILHARRIRRIK